MTYKEKIINLFDRLRPEGSSDKGYAECSGIDCEECPFNDFELCMVSLNLLMEFNFCVAEDAVAMAKIIDEEDKEND